MRTFSVCEWISGKVIFAVKQMLCSRCEKMWCGRPVRWSYLSTAETGGRDARTTKIQNPISSQLLCHYAQGFSFIFVHRVA
jgi:hypothetical protein